MPGWPLEQNLRVGQRHVPRGDALDALDQVPGGKARLGRGRIRQSAYHAHVTVPLGEYHSDVALVGVLVSQVLLVLIGVQVAGKRIDRLQQPVDRAQRHALQVGLFDVVALDAGEDLGKTAMWR